MKKALKKRAVEVLVQAAYGAIARRAGRTKSACGCCAPSVSAADYTPEEIAAVPRGAYLGEGSGAPVRFANLEPGEVVVDLGSGAGMDSFLAANAVGEKGRVHGFDLTEAMVRRAQRYAAEGGYANVRFERANIAKLPIEDGAADAAISNCVINLASDKRAVFREIFRVLRPGGRLSIADIVLRGSSEAIARFRKSAGLASWVACVSGALREEDYLEAIREAGFSDVHIVAERPARWQPGRGVESVAVTVTGCKPA